MRLRVPGRGGFVQRILASAIAGLLALALSGAGRAQSLDSELAGLLASHPQVLARMREAEAAEQGVRKAFAGYLPKLDVFGQTGPQYIDSPVLKSEGGGTRLSVAEIAGTRLTQNIFNGFATPAQVRSARLSLEAAAFTLQGVRQNVLFDGIDAYLEVLRQSRLVALGHESERTIMRQLHLEDERVQRGAGIAVDVLQAKSRLQVAKERRIGFEGGLADATTRYIEVFDHPPQPSAMIEPPAPSALLPDTLEQALATARQENPAIDPALPTSPSPNRASGWRAPPTIRASTWWRRRTGRTIPTWCAAPAPTSRCC
ncbi:MAG: TolC family protein [Rhodospirillales bacterium]